MNISHELPLQLLKNSPKYSDYDFCLPTYWYSSEEYKQYFLDAKSKGRFIIADNGLFEDDYFSPEDLYEFINELQPDYFVLPDVWNDAEKSLKYAGDWVHYIDFKHTKYMAVIQCTDLEIGSELYKEYIHLGVSGIAFNHSSEAYKDLFPHENIHVSKMMGRIQFINHLKKNNIIDPNIHHHLLGCNTPDEFKYYGKGYEFIKTADTSNPVIWGCQGKYYDIHTETSKTKPQEKIEVYFEQNITPDQISAIEYNIRQLKKYLNE